MSSRDSASLARRLARRIARDGPITVADYMASALTDPEQGYYMCRDPLGARGDFVTAPEVSQMFGELIGLWCADTWQKLGAPGHIALVELGPGRGTLMADALRAARQVPAFAKAIRVHLVEVSPTLKAHQAKRLADVEPVWHEAISSVPDGPALFIANEFFDALPVRQFVKKDGGWGERLVTVQDGVEPGRPTGTLIFTTSAPSPTLEDLVPESLRDAPPGAVFETSPTGREMAGEIARRLVAGGGAALVIDYGHGESAVGETLQAVRRHAPHDVLVDPGDADLTCHVDFGALAEVARQAGTRTHGPVPQGAWLRRLGVQQRAAKLMEAAAPPQRDEIRAALHRLTAADQMGELFKVLAITQPECSAPAGFP